MTQTKRPAPGTEQREEQRGGLDGADRPGHRLMRYLRRNVTWSFLYGAASYLRSSLWVIPFASILLVLAIAPALRVIDGWLDWRVSGLHVAGAQALYQSVITLTLSFMVFTFGSLLVAIQIASGQLTPRIIATTLLRDNVVRYSVGLFVFSLIFAIMALDRLDTRVNQIVTLTTAALGLACMATFLFLIDYAARLLRPVSILARVGDEGLVVIESVYPNRVSSVVDAGAAPPGVRQAPHRIVSHTGSSEIVLAVDLDTLASEAQRVHGTVELVPQVGDFVSSDEPLFVVYGPGTAAIDDARLRSTVAFGAERTMEQDPLFSFRIMVDIALKALSPAINDPTTAVLAIDQIHRLLRIVGRRQLRRETIHDETGQPRVIFHTPNWEDFVHLSCTEIRHCGAGSVQIARRLRAMIDNLVASLPAHRHEALEKERERLGTMIESLYPIAEDRALARIADSQGLGGSSGTRAPL
jgi:uncharacterized membrane protein